MKRFRYVIFRKINTMDTAIFYPYIIHSRDISELCRKDPESCDCVQRHRSQRQRQIQRFHGTQRNGKMILHDLKFETNMTILLDTTFR